MEVCYWAVFCGFCKNIFFIQRILWFLKTPKSFSNLLIIASNGLTYNLIIVRKINSFSVALQNFLFDFTGRVVRQEFQCLHFSSVGNHMTSTHNLINLVIGPFHQNVRI